MLVPDLDDVFFTLLVSQLEVMAQSDGYDIIVASSRDDAELEQSRLRTLLAWRPSGLIAIPCSDKLPAGLDNETGRLPMVFTDRVSPEGSVVDTVAIDNREAGGIAASSLAISPIRERVRGASALIRAARGAEPIVIELGSNAERGAGVFLHWLERHPCPTAVIALTNVTTLSTLSALGRSRIDVPDPVSVVASTIIPG